jgi:myo-inositol-1(or 4)-monophosphatase
MPKTTDTFQAELEVAIDAARRAGAIQRDRYERLERIVHKSEKDVVTEVDHLCEEAVLSTIAAGFPDDHSLAEERGASHPSMVAAATQAARPDRRRRGTKAPMAVDPDQEATAAPLEVPERLWVVDPLDGTINYANGIPFFCVSISLAVRGRPVVGVIYDGIRDELFSAVAGHGAQLDGIAFRHPAKERLIDCVMAVHMRGRGWSERERRVRKAIRVGRDLGSAALELAYVANGRFDAMFQAGGLSLWDVAAAGVIIEEAGARVTSGDGGAWFDLRRSSKGVSVLAAAPAHHATLVELLRANRAPTTAKAAWRV